MTVHYDIQLPLDKKAAELLVQILESFACGIEDADSWSGGKSVHTIDLIDNIVSTITLCIEDDEEAEEIDEEVGAGWLKI